MYKFLSPALLGLSLVSTACKSKSQAPAPTVLEGRAVRNLASAEVSPPHDQPDEPGDTPTAMALDEGKQAGGDRADGHARLAAPGAAQLSREQAIEQAITAGILGTAAAGRYGTIGQGQGTGVGRGLRGTADVSSGFDSSNIYGGGSEAYHDWGKNLRTATSKDHLSTFAADVDTASYTIARRKLDDGTLPPAAAVRVEEFVNYFRYAFPAPAAGSPFAVVMDAAPSPLQAGRDIVRVGVATRQISTMERKPAHLVFLVDVSGSMSSPDKLELAKQSLRILTNNLGPRDSVSLVTYAGSTRVVLPPTGMENKDRILAAIDELTSGGSTAMGSGLDLAYEQAMKGLLPGSISR